MIPKSGKRTYGLEYLFNGCAWRAERGLEVSLVALVDLERHLAFALSARHTPDSAPLPDSLGLDPKSGQTAESLAQAAHPRGRAGGALDSRARTLGRLVFD